ncbi:MAG: NFACT RNA binding domain-containing protein [Bacteroidota bacterium]
MHLNYYFLKRLSHQLNGILPGYELVEIFSQNKDELVLSFLKDKAEFHIKAQLNSQFACLVFLEEFARARKNSIDLFPDLLGLRVTGVRQFNNERSFMLLFENDYGLLFKMHGKRSNLLLYRDTEQKSMFNNQMKFDLNLDLSTLDRNIDQSEEAFVENGLSIFPTFDKTIKEKLKKDGFTEGNSDNWKIVQATLTAMNGAITICQPSGKPLPHLSLVGCLDGEEPAKTSHDPIEAINDFYYRYARRFYLNVEKATALRTLQKRIKQTSGYLKKTNAKLEEIEQTSRHKELADILMANLHQIKGGVTKTTLYDFYNDQQIDIKLKRDLSPQKNAEYYYRKAKNQQVEVDKLYDNLISREEEKQALEKHLRHIAEIEQVKELRKYLKSEGILRTNIQKTEEDTFKRTEIDSWTIMIGRNSRNNDELTQRVATKNDLWLHAKDVAGSHVIIRQIPGKPFPANVIERAAQLAAYYSKRKNDSLCPVIFTPRKYVRKPKGLAPGQVIVDREEVVLVVPMSLEELQKNKN